MTERIIQTTEEHQEEIEINFRLDGEGRTTSSTEATAENIIQYEPRSTSVFFDEALVLDELLLDCEIADSGLMPRTFWIGVNDTPQFSLEQMALDVFHHHVGASLDPSVTVAGAEWWVQLRPSPDKTGRYAMQGMTEENGITFHWDKDEDLRILCGGTTYIHPHLSTVTYLTSLGAPTLVTNARIHSLSGEWMVPGNPTSWISWPRRRKHFSFDGRYLHAAPMELMPKGLWEEQLRNPDPDSKASLRQHRRVTFLVNIWLHYKPFNVNRFPMAEKMSGYETKKTCLTFGPFEEFTTVVMDDEKTDSTRLTWPMGRGPDDCDEVIQMDIPLRAIHKRRDDGGTLQLSYKDTESVLLEKIPRESNNVCESEQSLPSVKRMKEDDGSHEEEKDN